MATKKGLQTIKQKRVRKPVGQWSFKPEFVEQAQKLCSFGVTDIELADFFKVTMRTITRWKAELPEFLRAMKAGKEQAEHRLNKKRYHRVSFSFDAVKIFCSSDGKVRRVPYRCIFRLINKTSGQWSDDSGVERKNATTVIWDEPLSEEQWERERVTDH